MINRHSSHLSHMNKYCKLIIIFVLYCLNGSNSNAQIFNPVSWNFRINDQSEIEIKATIQKGWHLYGMTLPEKEPRPFPTEFHFDQVKGAELVGKVTSNSPLIKKYDDIFEMEVNWYEKEALFIQKIKVTQPDQFLITGSISYMSCDDAGCVPGDEDFDQDVEELQLSPDEIQGLRDFIAQNRPIFEGMGEDWKENDSRTYYKKWMAIRACEYMLSRCLRQL